MLYQIRIVTLTLLTLFLGSGFLSTTTPGDDCLAIEYRATDCTGSKDNGKIYLKINKGDFPITFKLYDHFSGNYKVVAEKVIKKPTTAEFLIFDHLKSSGYLLQAESAQCVKTIGGIEGITIARKSID